MADQSSVVFDPFGTGDDDAEDYDDRTEGGNSNAFSDFFSASFDTSFESSTFQFPVSNKSGNIEWGDAAAVSSVVEEGPDDETFVTDVTSVTSGPRFDSAPKITNVQMQRPVVPPDDYTVRPSEAVVKLTLHEEMVCLYNSLSRVSSCSLKGTIHLNSSKHLDAGRFFLVIKDPRKHIQNMTTNGVQNVITLSPSKRPSKVFRDRDTVINVNVPDEEESTDMQLLCYTCPKMLSPVPIVVQNKVRIADKFCRVAVQIRSNPSNESELANVSVLMAVPNSVSGETVKMSRRGGVWDPMKRLIVWSIPELKGGETIDLQTQFEFNRPVDNLFAEGRQATTFPVLVRCSSSHGQLSSIQVQITDLKGSSSDIKMDLTRTFRVLYRKV